MVPSLLLLSSKKSLHVKEDRVFEWKPLETCENMYPKSFAPGTCINLLLFYIFILPLKIANLAMAFSTAHNQIDLKELSFRFPY